MKHQGRLNLTAQWAVDQRDHRLQTDSNWVLGQYC